LFFEIITHVLQNHHPQDPVLSRAKYGFGGDTPLDDNFYVEKFSRTGMMEDRGGEI
jgi:hypothetical protein